MRYGFIGLGNLGGHLAASLLKEGFDVSVTDIEPSLARRHLDMGKGCLWAETPAELAGDCDAIITCLPSPAVSENVLAQMLTTVNPGTTWIEMSTLGRDDIFRLATVASAKGVETMEAPVTGGVHLAARGKITVLAGARRICSRSTNLH